MRRLKLGVDVDGVVANFNAAYRKVCQELFGGTYDEEPTCWGYGNWGLTAEQHSWAWQKIKSTLDFYAWLEPLECMRGFNMERFADSHDLFFITTRPATAGASITKQTAFWLQSFLRVPFQTVLVTKNKGEYARVLKLDAFIDDKPENLVDVQEHSPNTGVYLCNASHNQNPTLKLKAYIRMESFPHFAKEMDELAASIAA